MKPAPPLAEVGLRFERKFTVRVADPVVVVRLLASHSARFSRVHPPRDVNNVYLDTPGLRAYTESEAGLSRRFKARIRWYGAVFEPGLARLEIKERSGRVGAKRVAGCAPFPFATSMARSEVAAWVTGLGLEPRDRALLGGHGAVLVNRYHRDYFASADRRFRITVDREHESRPYAAWGVRAHRVRHPEVIVELKYPVAFEAEGALVAAELGLRPVRSSKYATGVAALFGCR